MLRSRMKHAFHSPAAFISELVFKKFPEIAKGYKLVTPFCLFDKDELTWIEVEAAIVKMKDLLLHAIIRSQENNWMLVTEVEAYYLDHPFLIPNY